MRPRIYKALVILAAISIAVLLLIAGLSGGRGVFAENNPSSVKDGTYLSADLGLALGVNDIRSTSDGGVYSSADSTSDSRYGHDFYFDPVSVSDFSTTAWDGRANTVGYGSDGFYLNYYTGSTDDDAWASAPHFGFTSKIKLTSDGTLAAALKQSLSQIKATVSFDYVAYNASADLGKENEIDYTDYFDFNLSWSPDGTVDNMTTFSRSSIEVESERRTFSTVISLSKSNFSADSAYLDITFTGFSTHNADMQNVGTELLPSTGIFVKFSDVRVSVESDSDYTLGFGAQALKAEETGAVTVRDDRGTVYTSDEKSSLDFAKDELGSFSVSDGAVYLKYSDKLYLYSNVFYTDASGVKSSFEISDDYSKALNSTDRPVTWILADGQSGLYDWYSTLLVDENPSGTKNQRDGKTSVYKVKYDGEEEKTLVLIPRILYSYSTDPDTGEITHSYVTGNPETIYLDNSVPSTPVIDPDSSLGAYGYDESVYGVISEQNALRRYNSSLQLQFKLSNISDIYTTTGTARAPETVYYTIDEDEYPTDASSDRKKAVFSKDGTATIAFEKKGFYTVRLATVDAAGNYSDVVTYRIVVDNTDYKVTTAFYGGLSSDATSQTLSDASMDKIARVYMTTSSSESDKLTKKKSGSYKRGTTVTVRAEMTAKQYADYKLVAVYNGGKGSSYLTFSDVVASTPVWDSEKSVYVYEISLLVDKYVDPDLISEGNNKGKIASFNLTIGDVAYEMYNGVVTRGSESVVGGYDYSTSVLTIDGTDYYVVTDGLEKGVYTMTPSVDGTLLIDGERYATALRADAVLTIKGTNVDLVSSVGSNAARTVYFAFKQRIGVTVTETVTTFDYDVPTASAAAKALSQNVKLRLPSDFTTLYGNKETFSGITHALRYYKAATSSPYSSLSAMLKDLSVDEALGLGHIILVTDDNGDPTAPSGAGEYIYTASIDESSTFYSDYYYYAEGIFTIEKTEAGVVFGESAFLYKDGDDYYKKTLEYASGGMSTMNGFIVGIGVDGVLSSAVTSIGVSGRYEIATDTPDYANPSATTGKGILVEIVFTPFEVNSYDGGKYAVLNASNVAEQRVNVYLEVSKRNVEIVVDEKALSRDYSGLAVNPDIKIKLHDSLSYASPDDLLSGGYSISVPDSDIVLDATGLNVSYRYRRSTKDAFSSTVLPINAGEYDAEIIVEGDNFYGSYVLSENEQSLIIEKKQISVSHSFLETYEYTYYSLPSGDGLYAYDMAEDANGVLREDKKNVSFDVVYEYGTEKGVYEPLTDNVFNAGYYRVTISVSDDNYVGEGVAEFRINRVAKNSSFLSISQPAVGLRDGVYARYGETLTDLLVTGGNGVNVKYFTADGAIVTVGGDKSFSWATRGDGDFYELYAPDASRKYYADTILDTVTSNTTVDIWFIPDDTVNFEPFTVTLSLSVDKALPMYEGDDSSDSFDAIFLPIEYGTPLSEAVLVSSGESSTVGNKKSFSGSLFYYYGGEKLPVEGTFSHGYAVNTVFSTGTQPITLLFTPSDSEHFESLENVSVDLTITKKSLTLDYDGGAERIEIFYGETPSVIDKLSDDLGIQGLVYVWELSVDDLFADPVSYYDTLPAGDYYARISVDSTLYAGEKIIPFVVKKATAELTIAPIVGEFEWDDRLSELNDFLNNGTAVLTNPNNGNAVSGTFGVAYGDYNENTTFENEYKNGQKVFDIRVLFTPSGKDADNYDATEFDYVLTVNGVTLSGSALDFENTSVVYDGTPHNPSLYVTHPTLDGGRRTDFSDYVSYSVMPVDKGTYSLVATIEDESMLYRGSATVAFTVEALSADKLSLNFSPEYLQSYDGNERVIARYTGEPLDLEDIFSVTGIDAAFESITYTLSVKNYAGYSVDPTALVDMGRYYAETTLYGNFSGTLSFYLYIAENSVDYSETDLGIVIRTYSPDSRLTGRINTPSISPSVAIGTVKYAKAVLDVHGRYVADGEFSETVPYKAGAYIARTFFDAVSNNGYQGSDNGIAVVIEKAVAVIETQKISSPVYTGEPILGEDMLNTVFSVKTSSKFDYSLTYDYSLDGEDFSSEPFTDAGEYFLRLTVIADDYEGSAVYKYVIDRADPVYLGVSDYNYELTIKAPIVYSQFVLRDDDNDYFNRTDAFRFNGSVVSGSILISGRESIKSLYAGSYERDYVFVPDNVNLDSYYGTVSFIIAKRDVSDYLVFDETSIDTVYDSTRKSAKVRFLTDDEIIERGLPLSGLSAAAKKSISESVTVSYNGGLTLPYRASVTEISATAGDVNYTASLSGYMTINKGVPEISAPLTGDTATSVSDEAIARIKGLGVKIDGTFDYEIISDGLIKLVFTPVDGDNLESAVVYAMIGRTVAASSVDGYGKTLEESVITIDGNPTDEIVWKNPSEKLRFGDNEYEAIYTYDGVSRTVNISVELTDDSDDNYIASFEGIYYVVSLGEKYGDGRVSVGSGSADGFSVVSLSDKDFENSVAGYDFVDGDIFATLEYEFGGVLNVVTVPVRLHLSADGFRFNVKTAYAGEKITLSDIYGRSDSYISLSVVGAHVAPEYIVTVTDSDGKDLTEEGIENVGVYTIRFVIDKTRSRYDGECTVSFTLEPTDLSSYIVVNDGAPLKKTFSEVYSIVAKLENCPVTEEVSFLYYYKKASDPDSAYSMYDVPSEAGEYKVKVVVSDSDYYGGQSILDYVIEKRLVTVMLNGRELSRDGDVVYRCSYGSVVIPSLAVSDGVGSYRLTYYKDGATYYDVPENAGDYIVSVTIDETNYVSDATFTLSVARLKPTFTVEPGVEDIYYGTGLSYAVISSYVADTEGTVRISDEYLYGDNLHVGDNEITLVFTPVNSNYETVTLSATIRVVRATAGFDFNVTEVVYTGEEIVPSYTTDSFVDDDSVVFTVYNAKGELAVLKNAGTYYVRVEVGSDGADSDYYYTNVPSSSIGDFSTYQKLIIKKASASGYVTGSEPVTETVEYGDPLSDSAITGSVMSYDDGKGGEVSVRGSFAYVSGNVMLYTVGDGQLFDAIFTPDDDNYEPYRFRISVDVKKKSVSIAVTDGNRITYGEKISSVTDFSFRIDGHSDLTTIDGFTGKYSYLVLEQEELYVGTVLNSGSYQLRVTLEHNLYEGYLDYILTVDKKEVSLSFYRDAELNEELRGDSGYTFAFGENGNVYAGLSSDFVSSELDALSAATGRIATELISDIAAKVRYSYVSTDGLIAYDGLTDIKKQAGRYKVKAELYSSSDFVGIIETYVTVKKNEVGRVDIDFESLNDQVYGSVTEPIVSVYDKLDDEKRLTGISYYITWGDSRVMPTTAGKHNGKLIVDDPNYDSYEKTFVMTINPKELTVTELKVYDRDVDGTPWLTVTAKITGMLPGDEVELDIEAYTYDKETSPGRHDVIISKCSLYGLDAGNYTVTKPSYNSSVTIFSNEVYASDGESYVVYSVSKGDDVTFSVTEIDSEYNKTGFVSFVTGQSATVMSYSVRKDGMKVALDTPVRVYIKIPEKYRNRSDLVVEGVGTLGESGVTFSIEGDYVTFTTSVSGEIVFTTSGFPYGVILIAAGLLVLVIGLVTIAFIDPSRSKSGFSGVRRVTKTDEAYRKYNLQKKAKESKPPTDRRR